MNNRVIVALVIFWFCIFEIETWDLSSTALFLNNTASFRIVHVSVFYIRAFLCIKSLHRNVTVPTLIEAPWPENIMLIKPKIFPTDLIHAKGNSECNSILDAIGTSINEHKGHLWVLDNGSKYCGSKIIIFDLLIRNEEIHRFCFKKKFEQEFTSITVTLTDDGQENRAFLTLKNSDFLIMYSRVKQKWWKIRLITNSLIVVPNQIVFQSNRHMFITDLSGHLWVTKLEIEKYLRKAKFKYLEISVTLVENLLGTAMALTIDPEDSLYYYIPRDGAIVRWDSKKPLNAESHDILHFTTEQIMQIIFGAKGSVWIVNESTAKNDHCERILPHYTAPTQL